MFYSKDSAISSYLEFLKFRKVAERDGKIDLKDRKWISSTGVVLLAYLKEEYGYDVVSSDTSNAMGYFDQMTNDPTWWTKEFKREIIHDSSYIPFSELPPENISFKILFERIGELMRFYAPIGGETAFKYVLSELTDNIYEHSKFTKSFIMCQAYKTKQYVELSLIDNGISIPGNFETHSIAFHEDSNAIEMAVNGESTKGDLERGTGLKSSLDIYCEGAKAEAMIVSRNGIYYRKSNKPYLAQLDQDEGLLGTLISIRVPLRSSDIEIYKFLG
jgi:hypothetical protein